MSAHDPIDLDEFRAQVRTWIAEQELPEVPNDLDAKYEVLRPWQRTLADAGWLGVDWPKDAGGRGLSALHQMAVMEELILADAPLPPAVVNLVVAGPTILNFGTPEQKKAYLPGLLTADEMWCQGFSEPDAGSDLASLRTSARTDGDDYVVNGQKVWTSYAHRADYGVLLVRTDPDAPPHRGISCLIVDMRSPGVTVRGIRQLTGSSEFNEVFFDEVRVPRSNLLGEENAGWKVAMVSLGNERGRILVQRRTSAEVAFRGMLRSLREWRGSSGGALSDEVLTRIGLCRVKLAALEAQTRKTLVRLEQEVAPSALDSLDKLVLTDAEQAVHSLGMDLLGPYRLADGSPLGLDAHRWQYDYFYARSWTVSGGTLQIQRNIVAERLLGLPRT